MFLFALVVSFPLVPHGQAFQGAYPTLSVYLAIKVNEGRSILIEVNQALVVGNHDQNLEALRSLKCLIENIGSNLHHEIGLTARLMHSLYEYPIGLKLADNISNDWREGKFVIINIDEIQTSNERLQEFWLVAGDFPTVENIREIENPDIRFFLSTDPNYRPMKTTYTVKANKNGDEIPLRKAGMQNIKKHNADCTFNYSPSSRVARVVKYILQ
jgi:hypothetical protein